MVHIRQLKPPVCTETKTYISTGQWDLCYSYRFYLNLLCILYYMQSLIH